MSKIFLLIACSFLFITSCKKSGSSQDENLDSEEPLTQRKCGAQEVLEEQMKADPSLRERMNNIEIFIQRAAAHPENLRLRADGVIEIPVVVNVLYKTNAQNVSAAQIQSQIDALNNDFSAANSDYNTSTPFLGVRSGDLNIRFVLDAVNRLRVKAQTWPLNDAMKKASQGGINPTSPATKMNIWVCNLTSGYLGYAQFPGGNAATDGIVIDDNAFGTTGTAQAPYNKGRTATHEIGHWMNLRHIWGDANCGNDLVDDTPLHDTYNFGCPGNITSNCGGPTHPMMTMNYMDYTDDPCMYMFTAGQKTRIQTVFAVGGPRNSFAQP